MSNYLAIATVTATLQRMLQAAIQVDVAGSRVTTVRPDASGNGLPDIGVNICLYQVNPNPAWRNADLRPRRPKGELIKQAQAGLDLFYLLSFYGNEVELEPQRLLGTTVRTLVDQPIMTPEIIQETVNNPNFSFLAGSTLAEQIERVTFVPVAMSTDDLSKVWSVFFQTAYTLSFACQGSTVLIEGEKSGRKALPLRSRQFYLTASQPVIEQVVSETGENHSFVANNILSIRGRQLNAEVSDEDWQQFNESSNQSDLRRKAQVRGKPQVRIGESHITPQEVSSQEVQLNLATLPPEERHLLRYGVQSLQVVYPIVPQRSTHEPQRIVGSNIVPFVLRPIVIDATTENVMNHGDGYYSAEVVVRTDLALMQKQRIFLLLNELLSNNPEAYIFAVRPFEANTNIVVFPVQDVKQGRYLVRLEVDGAESKLDWDENIESPTFEQYIRPIVEIPS
jgi:hypothetical protein